MPKKELTWVNKSAETGETFEELRKRIGEDEFKKRAKAAHDRAMAAAGYYPVEKAKLLCERKTIKCS